MSWRFFRRIPISSLVRVNVSKRGASVSVGPPGATVTIGQHGVRGTIGLPGTGLSASKYLAFDGSEPLESRRYKFLTQIGPLFQQPELSIEDLARILLWQDHYQITDDDLGPKLGAQHRAWREQADVQAALAELRFVAAAEAAALTPPPAPPRPAPLVFRVLWIALLALAALGLLAAWVNAR